VTLNSQLLLLLFLLLIIRRKRLTWHKLQLQKQYILRVRAIEQVSFQVSFEGHQWGGCSHSEWQTVPHACCCYPKSTITNGL